MLKVQTSSDLPINVYLNTYICETARKFFHMRFLSFSFLKRRENEIQKKSHTQIYYITDTARSIHLEFLTYIYSILQKNILLIYINFAPAYVFVMFRQVIQRILPQA